MGLHVRAWLFKTGDNDTEIILSFSKTLLTKLPPESELHYQKELNSMLLSLLHTDRISELKKTNKDHIPRQHRHLC